MNFKGLEYEPVFVHLAEGNQRETDHLARNPQGLVPVLEDGEVTIGQSVAIFEYLEETHPPGIITRKSSGARGRAANGKPDCLRYSAVK